MNYRARHSWPLISGALSASLIMLLGATGAIPAHDGVVFAGLALIAGLGWQLVVVNREGLIRERRLVTIAADLRGATATLERLATIDSLTGVRNRRAFFDGLGSEFRRSQRYGRDLSVVMIDLDDFKQVNDEGGHLFGDFVLTETARLISEQTRESDLVARYGGEEFVVMLPDTSEEGALAVADKLLRAVEAFEYRSTDYPPRGEPGHRITISAGVTCGPVDVSQDENELVRRADRALYAAKRAGKNRIHRWTVGGSAEASEVTV